MEIKVEFEGFCWIDAENINSQDISSLIYSSFDPEPRFMSGATKHDAFVGCEFAHDVVDLRCSIAAASSWIGRSPGGKSRHRGICQNEEKENPAASVLLHPMLRVGDGCFVVSMGHKGWMVRQVRQTLTLDRVLKLYHDLRKLKKWFQTHHQFEFIVKGHAATAYFQCSLCASDA